MQPTRLDGDDGGRGDDRRTAGGHDESGSRDGRRVRRRAVLGATAGGVAAAVAGCLSGGGSDGDASGPFADWLGDLSEYDGVVDETGSDRVTVAVGADDDGLAFDPIAVAVDEGTTVVWEWTGTGGRHNVVERDGAFESDYHRSEGATFEWTFDDAGTFAYYCDPHRQLGMKGGIEVR